MTGQKDLGADLSPSPSPESGTRPLPHANNWRERLAMWVAPRGRLASLARECAQHRAAAEGRWLDFYLMSMNPVHGERPGFEVVMRSPIGLIFAEHMGQMLESVGAESWVEVEVGHPKHGQLVFTVQRAHGETPGKAIARLTAQLAETELAGGEKLPEADSSSPVDSQDEASAKPGEER